jgi:dolichyl-phosphate-mannose-protein mannosyltransferase
MEPRQRAAATVFVSAVILPVAAAARLWGIRFCVPHPQCRPDEDAISAIAGAFRGGDLNPHVFNYPALFMLAVAAVLVILSNGERLLHKAMPFHFRSLLDQASMTTINYMVARLLSAAAGIASVWVIFRIALRLFDRTAALAAAALLALAFLHVRDSHYGVTDVPMTFMVLITFLYVVRLSESGARKDLVMAALTAGLATSTKYNAALVSLPALFAIFGCLPGTKSIQARLADAAIFGVLTIAAFVCTSPYSLLDFQHFMADVMSDAQHLSEGHGVVLGRGWVYHATTTLRYGVGAPILGAGVTGILLLIFRDPRRGSLVALFPVSYYALLGSGYTVFTRHMVPVVPFLCLSAAYFIVESAYWLAMRLRRPQWSPTLVALGLIGVLLPSVHSVVMFDLLMARTDNRLLARRWVEQRFQAGTTIAQIGPAGGQVFRHDPNEVRYTTIEFSRDGLEPDIVIVQSSPLVAAPALGDMDHVLSTDYTLGFASEVAAPDPHNVYDLQDEFYLPFAGFHRVDRPGPNLKIYVRRGKEPDSHGLAIVR